jgi:hypothetical protein
MDAAMARMARSGALMIETKGWACAWTLAFGFVVELQLRGVV